MDEYEMNNTQEDFNTKSEGPEQPKDDTSDDQQTTGYHLNISQMIELNESTPPVPIIWGGIKVGSFGFVFGPSKSGKTIFCENLGLSIALGYKTFLGLPIEVGPEPVYFISLEEFWQFRTDRNKKQISILDDLAPNLSLNNYLTVRDGFLRYIHSQSNWIQLEETIIQSGARIVIIDSLTRMNYDQIEDSKTAEKICLKLRELANKLKITLIVIHHSRKQNGAPITIDCLAGSRILAQEADFLIGINRGAQGVRYYKEVAFRYAQENDETVIPFTINQSCWLDPMAPAHENIIISGTSSDGREDDTNYYLVLQTIKEIAEGPDKTFTSASLETDLVTPKVMSKTTLFEKIKKLMMNGLIEKTVHGIYKLK